MDTLESVPSSGSASLLTCGQRSENEKRDEEVRHKQEFELQIRQMLSKRGGERRKIFSCEKLKKYISEVKAAKLKKITKTSHEYDLLSRYDVKNTFGEDILVTVDETEKRLKRGIKRKLTNSTTAAAATSALDPQRVCRRFIHQGQLYDTIYDAHNAVGHGGEKRTYFQISKTVANVTQEEVKLFISLCQICNLKRVARRKKGVVKPIVSESFGERGQMDLIDMHKDGGCLYNYILHYQDNLTKFSVLRPLRTKQAIEVARHLLDIFTLIGAPRYLQSDNGREFVAAVIHQLRTELWPKLILINGKPRHPQSQGSIERANGDITKMLGSWMCENRTRDWSAGLPFVQFNKNIAYSRGIGLSPYKAVFGIEPPIGMQTELSPSMYKQLQGKDITEEDLLTMNLIEEEEEEDDPIGDQERSREQDVEEHHHRQPPTADAGNQNETIINTRDSETSSPILPQQEHHPLKSSHSNTTTSSAPEIILISPLPPPPSLPPILLPREIMDDELNKITRASLDDVNNEEMGAAPTTPSSSHHEMMIIRSPPPSSPPPPPSPPLPSLPPIILPLKIMDDELNKVTEAPLGRVNNEEIAAAPTTPSSSDHGMVILSSPLPLEPHLLPSSPSPPLVVLSPKIIIRQLNNSGDTPSRTDSESEENNNNIDADIDNHPPHHLHVKKVKEIRNRVKERQKSNAFKMLSQSSSDVTPISLYDAVNVIIPKADRESKMGMRTISGIVIEIDHQRDLYRVATKFGTIDQYLSRTDFDKCVDRIIPNQINKSQTVGLREVVRRQSDYFLSDNRYKKILVCHCKLLPCLNHRCICRRYGQRCTPKCRHNVQICKNCK